MLTGGAAPLRGQSALDGFDPNANGAVRVVAVQPDGKTLIGGAFTTLSPNGGAAVTRNHIARLNPDGTLDAAFNAGTNDTVRAIAVQTDGKILIGGDFTAFSPNGEGTITRNRIARLDPDGTLDAGFNPDANDKVFAIAVQVDGKILAGGAFHGAAGIGGIQRNYIARLDAVTGSADSFNPDANGRVLSIMIQRDGKILAGGEFTVIDGQTRNYIARLDAMTGSADSFDPNANSSVFAIALQADDKILAGGFFASIGGQARNHIARLDPTTGLADSFDPNADERVLSIAVQDDGKILAGGDFFYIGGESRIRIARLDAATGLADPFDPSAGSRVYSIVVQPDGKLLLGGDFPTLAPNGGAMVSRNRIARLETDGRLDQTLNLNVMGFLSSYVVASAVQPDGKVLIGGNFTSVLGTPRNNIARLNTDGTLDTVFNPNASSEVDTIAVQPDGKILVGGFFNGANSIGGQTRNFIARLDGTTGLADSFNPNANNIVRSLVLQSDGKILVGGYFSGANSIGGQSRNRIARLDAATGLADSFNPSANNPVFSIAVQPDGKILAGGSFNGASSIGGQSRNRLARLDPITGLADSFDPNANNIVFSIAVQPDGKILAGGSFNGANSIGGQTRNYVARLDPMTGLADSFDPNANNIVSSIAVEGDSKILVGGYFNGANSIGGQTRNRIARLDAATGLADSFDPNANNIVFSIAVQPDGKILAGGAFNGANSIGGQTRDYFARLSNDSAALQNLVVTRTAIIWTRGSSSPQFSQVSFESSADNVKYSFLGDGISLGSNWVLSGLDLPTGENFYVRARGYYSSASDNGSESIAETVRNAFLHEVPLTSVGSRKVHGETAFDVNLPLTGNPGVECRSGGASGEFELVFTFTNSIISVGDARVTSGTGNVSNRTIDADPHNYVVNLTGVTSAQVITVTLTDVNDSTGNSSVSIPISMRMLLGDTNGNGSVNASDVSQTKSQIGEAITSSNFRNDVNANGTINATDVSIVKAQVGSSIP